MSLVISCLKRHSILILVLGLLLPAFPSAVSAADAPLPTPSQFLKFQVGADRQLADYRQIVSYFKALAAGSNRIQIENIGPTTLNNDFIVAVISSEENLRNKKKYQEIARKLADPRGLTQQQIDALAHEGKLILLITCNIHSSEIGSSQMAMEWAHALVTAQDEETRRRLDNVILLLMPSLNPDGQIMETEWFRKNLGTRYEGGRMPWLYHHYVGHDNNRDWYMLTQKESLAVTRMVYSEWFPQVWLDEHQMGGNGPRMFVPPYSNPASPAVDPLVWRGINLFGATMAWRLEEQQKSGVGYGMIYDAYWPGSTEGTAWWKNIFGLLTEVASARLAAPREVLASELSGSSNGLVDYAVQVNYPNPWPGGTWRLRDIMDYERIASDALLEATSNNHVDLMRDAATLALDSIRMGKEGEYWRIPAAGQHDPITAARLAHLMKEHGVEVMVSDSSGGGKDFLIATAQPYGRFVKEMFEPNRYPKVRTGAGGGIITPYDVTAWDMPMMMGVTVEKTNLAAANRQGLHPLAATDWPQGGVQGSGKVYAVAHDENNVTRLINANLKAGGAVKVATAAFDSNSHQFPPGSVLFDASPQVATLAEKYHVSLTALPAQPAVTTSALKAPRVGLYKSWAASMDEGWTRWLLEQYEFNLKNVDNKTIQAGKLNDAFDVIVLPDVDKDVILEGRPKPREDGGGMRYFEEMPAEYSGGIGKEGSKALKDFVNNGGTIVALASSGSLLIDEFNLPVRNALSGVRGDDFSSPGSILRINLDPTHPVAYGMSEQADAFVDEAIAYQTASPGPELHRAIIGWYPSDAQDILRSGWLKGGDRLERRAAAVSVTQGKGKMVLLGFRVQHRAQTEGTFKLLFNAIHWGGMSGGPAPEGKGD